MEENFETINVAYKACRARRRVLKNEASNTRSMIKKTKKEIRASGQTYTAHVTEYHKLNDDHVDLEKEARNMFQEIVEVKREKDKFNLMQIKVNKELADKTMMLSDIHYKIKALKKTLEDGMKVNFQANNKENQRTMLRLAGMSGQQ
jgi:hypothetical protein